MPQPRTTQGTACRGRFPFDHCTLAEVDEARRLWTRMANGAADNRDIARLHYLWGRRVLPQYETKPKGAA